MSKHIRAFTAELIATFALCFIGAGAIVTNSYSDGAVGLVGIALAHALTLAIMVNATGHISGGHVNPAVTFGFLVTRRIEVGKGVGYIISQLAGGVLAGFALRAIFSPAVWSSTNLGTPGLASGVPFWNGVFLEAILTFFLVFTVFATAVDDRAPKNVYGFAIGLVLLFDILMGGPLTGASMNPARTFGPAVASGFWANHLVYWLGPLIGGGVAALLYNNFLLTSGQD
ncbi:MAG: MIP family channel protein [Calditrichaeota bacterium]|nr:MAG: MIP family channel protein [Calditrichota bacterium]